MTTREPERIIEESSSAKRTEETSDADRITTADLAATATAPTKARAAGEAKSMGTSARVSDEERFEMLFNEGEADELRSRWYAVQTEFVDQPRRSVEEADELVATVMKRLAEVFATERENLEKDWRKGEDVSTEDLRLALRRYRAFFDRLLSV